MMNDKIVFFDIDGTLLDHDKNLPQSTKLAIQNLKEKGVHVAIATGRAPFMFADLMKELGIDTFVSFNGQYVMYDNEVVHKQPLSTQEINDLEKIAMTRHHPMVFLNQENMFANKQTHPQIKESIESLKVKHPLYDPLFYHNNEIYQALLFCEGHEEEQYISEFSNFHFIRWHEYSLDILPKGGSKAIGIQKMTERLGFSTENVYAFGDGLNDLEMLGYVGTSVAMGNALPEVKGVANFITKNVDEDGIMHGLKEVGLL